MEWRAQQLASHPKERQRPVEAFQIKSFEGLKGDIFSGKYTPKLSVCAD